MTIRLNRRQFLQVLGAGPALASLSSGCRHIPAPLAHKTQPIRGSWISVWWDDRRHFYWNDAGRQFTAKQWQLAIKDAADLGFEYLVLLAVAKGGKAFYDTPLLPKLEMACADPIGAMLNGADRYGVKFFISSDWYGEWDYRALLAPDLMAKRFQMMRELAERYASHPSFYGWYWPNEACLSPLYSDDFMRHVNACSQEARRLTPKTKTLIAPYGTHQATGDDAYVRQLEQLDVDIIAYQDEVGCLRMTAEQSAEAFKRLRRAHDRVPQRALWADVEVFAWEGPANEPSSPLIPAPFERVRAQLEAVSPHVDKILIYQYQGLMNKRGSRAFAGHPQSLRLYEDYVAYQAAGRNKMSPD
jgi:hypothetical protein